MIALELLSPGFGSTAVAEHLADVQAQAHRDLLRAPTHLAWFSRVLDAWADEATTTDRALLDRAGPALAVSQFARRLPPASTTGRRATSSAREVADLVTHGWLRPVVAGSGRSGSSTVYRAQVGAPFGVIR
jgi:hypothetical protein